MKHIRWKAWIVLVASGAILFQAPSCIETASVVTSVATVATAGGVFYLISQILTT